MNTWVWIVLVMQGIAIILMNRVIGYMDKRIGRLEERQYEDRH